MKTQTTEHRQQNTDNRTQQKVLPHRLGSGLWVLSSNKGLTLIEVLVAVTILAIGLLGVALMQVASISGTTYSREMATATDLGQDMLEKLMASPYTAPGVAGSASPGTNHPTAADMANGLAPAVDTDGVPCNNLANMVDERGLPIGPPVYIRTWTVTDDEPGTNMKTIAVTICWADRTGDTHTVTLEGVKVQ